MNSMAWNFFLCGICLSHKMRYINICNINMFYNKDELHLNEIFQKDILYILPLIITISIVGQSREPGTSYSVLYSLQRMVGRKCDFKTYTDTEVNYFFNKYRCNKIDWTAKKNRNDGLAGKVTSKKHRVTEKKKKKKTKMTALQEKSLKRNTESFLKCDLETCHK